MAAQTLLITGATSGLGLAAAEAAAERGDVRVLVGGHSRERARGAAARVGGEPAVMDLKSLEAVRAAARELPSIDRLACNAGVKVTARDSTTVDGFDETFQVNHLSHLVLIDELFARGDPLRRIVLTGSSAHDPEEQRGRMSPPLDADVETLARGGPTEEGPIGLRRYASSKLLTTATALGLAREHPERHITCFDPGFMPGTGLERQQSAGGRILKRAATRFITMLPMGTTPQQSGKALAQLLLEEPPPAPSGTVVAGNLGPGVVSSQAQDEAFQDDVIRVSRELAARQRSGERSSRAPGRSGSG